jgi:DNA-binding LytR/AlgR family response regulator
LKPVRSGRLEGALEQAAHLTHGQDLIDESLKSLEQAFASEFVRIHRSALVRVDAIDRLEKRAGGQVFIVLRTDTENGDNAHTDDLIVSRRHRASVRRRIKGR